MDDDGHHHPVAYESRKLTAAEQAYPSHVLELLAVVHALRVFRHYLLGSSAPRPPGILSDFTLRTDNQAVSWLRTKRDVNRFLARWLDEIEEFRFEVEHVPGRLNPADPLTRRGLPQPRALDPVAVVDQGPGPVAAPDRPPSGDRCGGGRHPWACDGRPSPGDCCGGSHHPWVRGGGPFPGDRCGGGRHPRTRTGQAWRRLYSAHRRPGAVAYRRGHCPSQPVTAGAPLPGPRLCRSLESGDAHGPVLWTHL